MSSREVAKRLIRLALEMNKENLSIVAKKKKKKKLTLRRCQNKFKKDPTIDNVDAFCNYLQNKGVVKKAAENPPILIQKPAGGADFDKARKAIDKAIAEHRKITFYYLNAKGVSRFVLLEPLPIQTYLQRLDPESERRRDTNFRMPNDKKYFIGKDLSPRSETKKNNAHNFRVFITEFITMPPAGRNPFNGVSLEDIKEQEIEKKQEELKKQELDKEEKKKQQEELLKKKEELDKQREEQIQKQKDEKKRVEEISKIRVKQQSLSSMIFRTQDKIQSALDDGDQVKAQSLNKDLIKFKEEMLDIYKQLENFYSADILHDEKDYKNAIKVYDVELVKPEIRKEEDNTEQEKIEKKINELEKQDAVLEKQEKVLEKRTDVENPNQSEERQLKQVEDKRSKLTKIVDKLKGMLRGIVKKFKKK